MISRRLLRIKTLQISYAYLKSSEQSLNKAEKELFFSVQKSYDLYHYLMLLTLDVTQYAESRIDLAKQKRMPTEEDLNPNTKFIDNKFVKFISYNLDFNKYINERKLSWTRYPELVKSLYTEIRDSELYKEYMSSDKKGFSQDKKFITDIYAHIIANFEPLYQNLEEQSIYWNDEIDFVIGMIVKTFRSFKLTDGEDAKLMPLFKSEDDREFVKRLFRKVILNFKEYEELISKYIKNWDVERLAFMDIIVMSLAVTEIVEFPEIPVKVSLDEYIEIAKYYSTQKSNVFINGILDKVVEYLKKENRIRKVGRGLIGENN